MMLNLITEDLLNIQQEKYFIPCLNPNMSKY